MKHREMLNALLLHDPSKKNIAELVKFSAQSPDIPTDLFKLALEDNYPQNWRAAWILKGMWEIKPHLVEPFLNEMIHVLPGVPNDGVRRELLRIISEYPVPENEDELGILLSHCFDSLAGPFNPIAVKIHSITILVKIAALIPEIREELASTIAHAMQEGSPGILNRGTKALKALQRMNH